MRGHPINMCHISLCTCFCTQLICTQLCALNIFVFVKIKTLSLNFFLSIYNKPFAILVQLTCDSLLPFHAPTQGILETTLACIHSLLSTPESSNFFQSHPVIYSPNTPLPVFMICQARVF